MEKGPAPRNQQQTPSQLSARHDDKAAKGYPAVSRFAQAPTPSADNSNGLPHQLRQGVEALSGMSMADTSVHYNSSAPAQIGALAYAKGSQIHLGPGQEQHLPHEAWHVVQQKQGRVKPTLQAKGFSVNDDQALETEANVMGQRAAQLKTTDSPLLTSLNNPAFQSTEVVQRKIGFEFQAYGCSNITGTNVTGPGRRLGSYAGNLFVVKTDSGAKDMTELEICTKAVEETPAGFAGLHFIMAGITRFLELLKEESRPTGHSGSRVTKFRDVELSGFKWEDRVGPDADLDIYGGGHLHFHPQATVGVRFEKIAGLIDYLTQAPFKTGNGKPGKTQAPFPPSDMPKTAAEAMASDTGPASAPEAKVEGTPKAVEETKRDPEKTARAAVFGWSGMPDQQQFKHLWALAIKAANDNPGFKSPKVKGFAAFLYGFAMIKKYKIAISDGEYLKYWMPFMLRNGLRPFFDCMEAGEREELKHIDRGYLDTTMFPEYDECLAADAFNEMVVCYDSPAYPLTALKLLEDMEAKSANPSTDDKMDLFQNPFMAIGYGQIGSTVSSAEEKKLETWGMKTIDDIGISTTEPEEGRRRGAIIELRKLGNDVPVDQLKGFALAVFKFIMLINEERGAVTPTPGGAPTSGEPMPDSL
jgi:hypothetical protein